MSGAAGRFAPSPTGRMHLGNIFTALLSWLAARSRHAPWILRIEDLDPQRSRTEWAEAIEDDLRWLGLEPDQGGLEDQGPYAPYRQSLRHDLYEAALERLRSLGLTYPCTCTRAGLRVASAPHASDGRAIYPGTCRPPGEPPFPGHPISEVPHAERIAVPKGERLWYTDLVFGPQYTDLARECGDFVLRRADGAWAYQLAVTVDDALMGVGEVVRGCDLLLSGCQQAWLHSLLDNVPPRFAHVPLLCAEGGRRLSKRDTSMSMETLRRDWSPARLVGRLAQLAGLNPGGAPCRPADLVDRFAWSRIPRVLSIPVC